MKLSRGTTTLLNLLTMVFGTVSAWPNIPPAPVDSVLKVAATSPASGSFTSDPHGPISVSFTMLPDRQTLTDSTVRLFGSFTGRHPSVLTLDTATFVLTIAPPSPFIRGEEVTVVLTEGITDTGGSAIASSFQWTFRIRMGSGSGIFAPVETLAVGTEPFSMYAADLDQDGDIDLSVAHILSPPLLLSNVGGGHFTITGEVFGPSGVESATPIDVDGDGALELVTVSTDSASATFYRRVGDSVYLRYQTVAVGQHPVQPRVIDVDGDGDRDVVVDNYASHSVSVLKNDGAGFFHLSSNPSTGLYPISLSAGDLDGDGDLDLVTANLHGASVSILTNDGHGSFAPTPPVQVGDFPYWVTTADVDGDEDLDLVVTRSAAGTVTIFRNSGQAQFDSPTTVTVGLDPWTVEPADLDGDADVDLIVANYLGNSLSILRNDGTGSFGPAPHLQTGQGPRGMSVVDADGDGDADIAVASRFSHHVVLFGQSEAPLRIIPDSSLLVYYPFSESAADSSGYGRDGLLNGPVPTPDRFGGPGTAYRFDGLNDNIRIAFDPALACSSYTVAAWVKAEQRSSGQSQIIGQPSGTPQLLLLPGGAPSIVKRQPSGGWTYLTGRRPMPLDAWVHLAATVHADRLALYINGVLDTSMASEEALYRSYDSEFQIGGFYYPGTDRGGPYSHQYFSGAIDEVRMYNRELSATEIDSIYRLGGLVDTTHVDTLHVVSVIPARHEVVPSTSPTITVGLSGVPDRRSINDTTLRVYGSRSGSHQIELGVDTTTASFTVQSPKGFIRGEEVTVLLDRWVSDTSGVNLKKSYQWSFQVGMQIGGGSFVAFDTVALGDAPFSVYAADLNGDGDVELSVAHNFAFPMVLTNDGDGRFILSDTLRGATGAESAAPIDVDADGDFDLVTVSTDSGTATVHINDGSGTFIRGQTIAVGLHPVQPKGVDVDGDLDLDVIIDNYVSSTVSVLKNDGSGRFTHGSEVPVGLYPISLTVGDIDGDGDVDLATANLHSSSVSLLLNDGNGEFTAAAPLLVGEYPYWVSAADLDGDHDLDLAVSKHTQGRVLILLNNGQGQFGLPTPVMVGLDPWTIEPGDLDGDGDIDLVVANYSGNSMSVLLNQGDGHFMGHLPLATSSGPRGMVIIDADGDGDADLVIASRHSDRMTVYLQGEPPPIPIRDSTLLAHFTFTMNATDSSGYGRNGFLNGPVLTHDRFGGEERAYQFDGVNDNIRIAFSPALVCTSYTVTAWIRPDQRTYNQAQIFGQPGGVPQLLLLPDGRPSIVKRRPDGEWEYVTGRVPVPLYTWTHLAATLQARNMTLFVNGQSDTTASFVEPFWRAFDSEFQIGGHYYPGNDLGGPYSGQYFAGAIDDVRLYGRILSESELLAVYEFEDTTGTTPVQDDLNIPDNFRMSANFPNPFNPTTNFVLELPERSAVLLEVFDLRGRSVARLLDGEFPAGIIQTAWNAIGNVSGIYFYRVTAGRFSASGKMLLLK